MKKLATLSLVLLAACATTGQRFDPAGPIHDPLPPPSSSSTAAPADEFANDQFVQALNKAIDRYANSEDRQKALAINNLPGNNDKIAAQCNAYFADPTTKQRADELLHAADTLLPLSTIQPPIAPVGPLSLYAEARRQRRAIEAGAVALQAGAFAAKLVELRQKRMALWDDTLLACGPLKMDEQTFVARLLAP